MRHFIHFAIVLLVRGRHWCSFCGQARIKEAFHKAGPIFLHGNGLDNKGSVSFFLKRYFKAQSSSSKIRSPRQRNRQPLAKTPF